MRKLTDLMKLRVHKNDNGIDIQEDYGTEVLSHPDLEQIRIKKSDDHKIDKTVLKEMNLEYLLNLRTWVDEEIKQRKDSSCLHNI
jgi:hypothetical protein